MNIQKIRQEYHEERLTELDAVNALKELMPGTTLTLRINFLKGNLSQEEEKLLSSPENCKRLMEAINRTKPKGSFCPLR